MIKCDGCKKDMAPAPMKHPADYSGFAFCPECKEKQDHYANTCPLPGDCCSPEEVE